MRYDTPEDALRKRCVPTDVAASVYSFNAMPVVMRIKKRDDGGLALVLDDGGENPITTPFDDADHLERLLDPWVEQRGEHGFAPAAFTLLEAVRRTDAE